MLSVQTAFIGGVAYVVSSVIVNHADWRLGLPVIPKGLMVSPVVRPKQPASHRHCPRVSVSQGFGRGDVKLHDDNL